MGKRTNSKAARMLMLYQMQQEGRLDAKSLRQIGKIFGVNASTILRDLRDLNGALEQLELLRAEIDG